MATEQNLSDAEIVKVRQVYRDVDECKEELQVAQEAADRLADSGNGVKQVGKVYEVVIPEAAVSEDIAGSYFVRTLAHSEAAYKVLKHICGEKCVGTYGSQRGRQLSPKEAAAELDSDDLLELLLNKGLSAAQKRKLAAAMKKK